MVAGPDPGHAFPAIALSLLFRAAGDEPILFTGSRWVPDAHAAGLRALPLGGLAPRPEDDDLDAGQRIHSRAAFVSTELLPDLVARLSEGPFTLSHGDYRLDNIFFGAGDVALKVCDWQLVDRSRGARDLAYFTSQSLIPELRAEIERSLVERYVERLVSHGVDDYPFDVAWHDYRLATAFGFVYPVIAGGSLDHADERATNLTGEMFRRSVRAIVELDALELI